MKENNKTIIGTVFGGLFLSFTAQIVGNWLRPYFDNILKNVDMSHPMNISVLTFIPIGILSAVIMSVIVFWFLRKDDFYSTALGFSLTGFIIDLSRITGGILYFLLMGSKSSLLWFTVSFVLLYASTFFTMIFVFNALDKIRFVRK